METNTNNLDTQVQDTTDTNVEAQGEKTYTQAELDTLLQQETDRRVTAALKKQAQKQEARIKEAEKLAQMNEQQKYEYQLEQREKAIQEKERELALAENKNVAGKILAEKGLDLALVDFVVAEDAETMDINIKALEVAFNKSVKAEVERRLASKTPKKNLPLDTTIDKSKFAKLSTVELMELATNNPELYDQLSNT